MAAHPPSPRGELAIRTIAVEAWALQGCHGAAAVKVTEGVFTYVAIDDKGRKRPVPPA